MDDAIHIRSAGLADLPVLVEFQLAMARETEGKELDAAALRAGVRAVFEQPARGFYLLACAGDEAAASLLVTSEWSDWRAGEFWWIQSVYVAPRFRRRGLYRALYAHLRARAARENILGFRLYVERENRVAQKTYAALGMRESHYKMFEATRGRED